MLMLIIVVLGVSAFLINSLNKPGQNIERAKITADALAQAKDTLLGKSITYTDYPGSLPCPDTDNDGMSDAGGGSECPSYIGRLPWQTLGIADLRDASGERLWYALSRNFRRYTSVLPLNSNTKGTLTIYQSDGTTLQTQSGYDAVAVIFSPGSPVGSQTRNTAAEQNSAANYLDTANGRNNASATGPYVIGEKSDTFNDQMLFITTQTLMPLVEKRVATELKQALTSYYTANGYYPWADTLPFAVDYDANFAENRGWIPNDVSPGGTPDWVTGSPAAWFFNNEWYKLIYYSVARNYTSSPGSCGSCTATTLSVDGTSGVRMLFFMPGTPIGTLVRNVTSLPDYLEDSQNRDDANDSYVIPTSQALDRDRLYWLSSSSVWNQ